MPLPCYIVEFRTAHVLSLDVWLTSWLSVDIQCDDAVHLQREKVLVSRNLFLYGFR